MMVLCPLLFFASIILLASTSPKFLEINEMLLILLVISFLLIGSKRIRMLSTSVFQVQLDLTVGMLMLMQEYIRVSFPRKRKFGR